VRNALPTAIFKALLLVLPAGVRRQLGAEMEQVFACCLADARSRRGLRGETFAIVRGAVDILQFAAVSRGHEKHDRQLHITKTGYRPEGPMDKIGKFFSNLAQDLKYAARLLGKDRSFTITALLTLAICIAANTAIFSIVRSVVLRPLPVPNAERIVVFHNNYPNAGAVRGSTGVPDYFDRRAQTDVFEELALYRRQGATLGGKDGARRLTTVRATPTFYRLVSARPQLGRLFTDEEGEFQKDTAVILSDSLWRSEFGAAKDVVGKELRLSGTVKTIIGVMPKDFKYLWNDVDAYIAASFSPREQSDEARHSNNWQMIGMLKPGKTQAHAQEQVNAINARNDQRFPHFTKLLKDAGFYTAVGMLQVELVEDIKPTLFLLWGGVGFVLLIGCLNIANLVLVRSSGRSREMATRHAVGADIRRLGRQILTETTLLSAAGGALGLALGWWALRLVPTLGLDEMPRGHEIALDPVSVLVIGGAALTVGLLLGLMPIASLSRLNINTALREEGRSGTAGRRSSLVRRGLATAQVTIAFVLLIGAGLLLASFSEVLRLDTGFKPGGVITGALNLPATAYKEEARWPFVERLLTTVRALPGVESAGVTTTIPLSGDHNDSVILAEGYSMKEGESLISPAQSTASPGYFETMKIPLVRGRFFDTRDTPTSPTVIIIDERLANHFWPGQDPIGKRLYRPGSGADILKITDKTQFFNVVGVVKEVPFDGIALSTPQVGAYYYSYAQSADASFGLTVRTKPGADDAAATAAVRKALASIDPALPLYSVHSMTEYVDDALMSRRMPMLLAMGFAGVALFLSAIGIYGVLAYGVAQRRREIGIRLALGSTAGEVFGLVLKDGVKIVALGLALGFAGLFALKSFLATVLYGVKPMDPLVITLVAVTLSVVALLAMVIPARRAAKVSPATALTD
jgi:predicted permease